MEEYIIAHCKIQWLKLTYVHMHIYATDETVHTFTDTMYVCISIHTVHVAVKFKFTGGA